MKYSVLAIAQIAVGAAAIFARFALTGAGALAVSASRLAIAAFVLLAVASGEQVLRRRGTRYAAAARETMPFDDRGQFVSDVFRFGGAGVALAAHFACWIASLEYTSVAVSTLLVATTPVWTGLYDAIVYRRMFSLLALAAMFAGAAGMFFVVSGSFATPPVAGHELLGVVLAIAGAIAIAAYFIIVRSVRVRFGTRSIVTRTYAAAAAVLIVASAFAHQGPPPIGNAKAWFGILGMALVSQLVGHTALNAALRSFSASAVAFTTLLEPVAAALLAAIVFGEGLSGAATAGGVVLLAAVAVFLREEQRFSTLQ